MAITKKLLTSVMRDERGSVALPVRYFNWPIRELHSLPHLLKPARAWVRSHRRVLVLSASALAIIYSIGFLWPRNLGFSYASKSCMFDPVVFPQLLRQRPSQNFEVSLRKTVSIGGLTLFSSSTCVKPTGVPAENSTESLSLGLFESPFLAKKVTVKSDDFPGLNAKFNAEMPVSAKDTLEFSISGQDQIFEYKLSANAKSATCEKQTEHILCDVRPLELVQSQSYEAKIERTFNDQPAGEAFSATLKIAEPVQLVSSTVPAGTLVYSIPTELKLTFNKPLREINNVKLESVSGGRQLIGTKLTQTGTDLTVTFDQPLPRETDFELSIQEINAEDNSYLPAPLVLSFKTSGGPKVAGVSIGSYKVSTESSPTITFDVGLAGGQALASFARLEVGGATIDAVVSGSGRTITINPKASLPRCTAFTVKVNAGLVNEFGVGGGSAYSFNSRTICQSVFSIGYSVKGRSITAYKFGSGTPVIFVGGTHGNEKSSVYVLNSLIDDLERNAGNIPAHRSVVVIPNLNPDGYASGSRYNANGVDLNRNFPTNDWQSGVYGPGNVFLPNGGGSEPLDQPESSALASYVSGQGPRLVLTYHAVARVVISNDAGDSWAQAQTYGSKSGYRSVSNAGSDEEFDYSTTGEFEDWLRDKKGIAALLVELATMSGNEFSTHKNAMWAMIQL